MENHQQQQQKRQPPVKSLRFRHICNFCGSSHDKNPSYQLAAIQLGQQLQQTTTTKLPSLPIYTQATSPLNQPLREQIRSLKQTKQGSLPEQCNMHLGLILYLLNSEDFKGNFVGDQILRLTVLEVQSRNLQPSSQQYSSVSQTSVPPQQFQSPNWNKRISGPNFAPTPQKS